MVVTSQQPAKSVYSGEPLFNRATPPPVHVQNKPAVDKAVVQRQSRSFRSRRRWGSVTYPAIERGWFTCCGSASWYEASSQRAEICHERAQTYSRYYLLIPEFDIMKNYGPLRRAQHLNALDGGRRCPQHRTLSNWRACGQLTTVDALGSSVDINRTRKGKCQAKLSMSSTVHGCRLSRCLKYMFYLQCSPSPPPHATSECVGSTPLLGVLRSRLVRPLALPQLLIYPMPWSCSLVNVLAILFSKDFSTSKPTLSPFPVILVGTSSRGVPALASIPSLSHPTATLSLGVSSPGEGDMRGG